MILPFIKLKTLPFWNQIQSFHIYFWEFLPGMDFHNKIQSPFHDFHPWSFEILFPSSVFQLVFLFLDLLSHLGFSKIYQFHISGNQYLIEISENIKQWTSECAILQIWNTFLCKTSIAVCKAIALMSVFWSAAVKYMWISKNLCWPASSASCSSSNWFKSLKNHSNDFWSRLIQKKSTLNKTYVIQHYNSTIPFLQYVKYNN